MIVDLPESCEFVENSVMVGNSTSSYTLNGHQITIPMTRYTDRVRFCIIPTLGGEYAPSAFVQFNLNDETITQPIGSANYTAKDLSISVPSTVANTSVSVSGTAILMTRSARMPSSPRLTVTSVVVQTATLTHTHSSAARR